MDKIARIYQELDKRYQEYRAKMKTEDFTYYEGMADALDLFEQFLDTLSEEPYKEDLNDAIKKFIEEYGYERGEDKLLIAIVARHFAEWQASQMPMPEDTVLFQKGVAEGRRLEREDMMKDVVEGEAEELYNDGESQCVVSVGTYFKPGDKVYVLKAEEE